LIVVIPCLNEPAYHGRCRVWFLYPSDSYLPIYTVHYFNRHACRHGFQSKPCKGTSGVTLTIAPCVFSRHLEHGWGMYSVSCFPNVPVYGFHFPSPFCRLMQTCLDGVQPQVHRGDAVNHSVCSSSSTSPAFCKIPMLALLFPSLHAPEPALHSPLRPTKGKWTVDWATILLPKCLPNQLGHDNEC
jgi:hypothetical protein